MAVRAFILSDRRMNMPVKARIQLTGSKSESNRALIIAAHSNGSVQIDNLSNAEDTRTLQQLITDARTLSTTGETELDVGPAGTAMRFLTAYLPLIPGAFLLTGSKRMQERPIGILVEALQKLGTSLSYAGQTGYPPLRIEGPVQSDLNTVSIRGDVSSQYLSALALNAAFFPNGLSIEILGELTSRPYFLMTLQMLEEACIRHKWVDNHVHIPRQRTASAKIYIEPDWSAASYWYSLLALSPAGSEIELPGLKEKSLQGDRAIAEIMLHFGVSTEFLKDGIRIYRIEKELAETELDFKSCPDLAQSVLVCAAALGVNGLYSGLETLRIKETDRISALQAELGKFDVTLEERENGTFYLDAGSFDRTVTTSIRTYEDHRMAMAFAPLAKILPEIEIQEPEVVGKSYPEFWNHLKQLNLSVEENEVSKL